jgi:response regulator of citrate/malate metabolism
LVESTTTFGEEMSIEKALAALDKAREELLALQPKYDPKGSHAHTRRLILECCKTPKTAKEIGAKLGIPKSTCGTRMREMEKAGDIHIAGKRGSESLWSAKKQPKTLTKWQPVQPWGIK